ncbi:MATE family efflux transporter [Pseudolysinimonas sp.]|uniref:MATE family efflux transporter n=1 Tax=Pseudolysinimonas sp. TaxID=2680009 RepID=UPI003F7E36B0
MTALTEPSAPEARSDRWYLATAGIWRALAHLALPMIAAVTVGGVYSVINAGFIGALHSTALLSAITFGVPVFALIMAVGGVFGVGGSTAISRLMGSLDGADSATSDRIRDDIRRYAAFTVWGAVGAGVVIGVVCLLLLGPITAALGADASATGATSAYIGIQFAGAPILVVAFAIEQVVRAEGATRASMFGLIWSTVANLVFDVLFILVLGMGVFGAGLALVLSNAVAVAYYARFLQRRSGNGISLAPRWFSLRASIVREVFAIGSSELVMSSFLLVSSLLLNHLAVAYSDSVIAAFGVSQRIVQLPEFLCMGVTLGVLPLIAYSFGARNRERLRRGVRAAAITVAAFTLVFSGAVFLLRGEVFGLFSSDAEVLRVGVLILTAQLVSTIFNGFTGLIIAVFQGIGAGRATTIMSFAQGLLFIPIVIGANLVFGMTGLIWAMAVTEAIVLVVGLVLWSIERPTRRIASDDEASQALAMVEA